MEFMKKCYICNEKIEGEVHIITSIVPLLKYPEHAIVETGRTPEYIHSYPVCTACKEAKVLI